MKWSWKIGSVAGIGIYLHVTSLISLMENLGEFLMVQAALHGERLGRRPTILPAAEERPA